MKKTSLLMFAVVCIVGLWGCRSLAVFPEEAREALSTDYFGTNRVPYTLISTEQAPYPNNLVGPAVANQDEVWCVKTTDEIGAHYYLVMRKGNLWSARSTGYIHDGIAEHVFQLVGCTFG